MAPVFKDHPLTGDEIHALVAFFEHSAKSADEASASGSLAFLLLGALAAVGLLVAMDSIWRGRFRSVRGTLVAGMRLRTRETQQTV